MSPPSVRKYPEASHRRQSFTGREFRNFHSMTICERIFDRDQGSCVLPRRSLQCALEIGGRPYLQRLKLDPQDPGRADRLLEDKRGIRIGRIPEHGHAGNSREKLCEQFRLLRLCAKRPRGRRSAKEPQQLAASHSGT
jgi:hypothetical protein